jgi:GNAT superfamily N-acetyltransferase
MGAVACRRAVLEEAPDILAAIKAVAGEIPLLLDTLEREEALYRLIRNCARSGESWLAVEGDRIVGFLLAEPDQTDRFWGEHEVLELRHGGVLPSHRRQGVFAALLARVVERRVPLTAVVPAANASGVERLLGAAGFARHGNRWRREPGG